MTTPQHGAVCSGLYPYIDLHCDTVLALMENQESGKPVSFTDNDLHIDQNKLEQGNCLIQTMALFTDRKCGRQPEHQALRLLQTYRKLLKEHPNLKPVRTREDLRRLLACRAGSDGFGMDHRTQSESNKPSGSSVPSESGLTMDRTPIGTLLSLEEGDVMFQDLDLLELWRDLGVRMIALTWNYENAIGHPNFEVDENWDYKKGNPMLVTQTEKGLTDFGLAMIRRMEELGILVDVSHLGDKGFWDVIAAARKPVIASHSNARALCPVSRNLSDEMILALAKTGGVIGINFCADFLHERGDDTTAIDDLVRHILYIRDLAGIDHIALGSDFDGIHSRQQMKDASGMQMLFAALEEHGLSRQDIEKIAWKNMVRVLEQTLPNEQESLSQL